MNTRTAVLCLLLTAMLANAAGAFSEHIKPHKTEAKVSIAPVKIQWMGQIKSRRLNESSGLAV
ncbi:MAG: hypothetical protein VYB25_05070, partial [Pseudomonadota bacterium]|nr:hypothetical protein [Pseudomonadota bacterium]